MGSHVELVRELLHRWAASGPRCLEARAAWKDVRALDDTRPLNPKGLVFRDNLVADRLMQCCQDWVHFVHQEAMPLITAGTRNWHGEVVSPFVGGVEVQGVRDKA